MKGVWIVTYDTDPRDAYEKTFYTVGVFSTIKKVKDAHPNIYWHPVTHKDGTVFEDHWWGDANALESFQNSHYTADFFPMNEVGEWFLNIVGRNEQKPR